MPWELILTTLLPLVLKIFDKGVRDPKEFRVWGNRFRDFRDPEFQAFGEMLVCCSRDSELAAAQAEQFAMVQAMRTAEYADFKAANAASGGGQNS